MWLRRALYGWMIPAAFLLPAWLFVGWIVSGAQAWAFFWLFIAIPSVFIGQLVSTLLVRARSEARAERAVSWWDVAGFGAWNLLTISLGFFNQDWWAAVFVLTVAVGIALFWLLLWQLWQQARPSVVLQRTTSGTGYVDATPPERDRNPSHQHDEVFVITEQPPKT